MRHSLEYQPTGEYQIGEKRSQKRTYLRQTVIYGKSDPPGYFAFARDISIKGILIASRHLLGEGTQLHFTVRDEENRKHKTEGVVVRVDEKSDVIDMGGSYDIGIEFADERVVQRYHITPSFL